MPTHKPAAGKKTAAKKALRKKEPLLNAVARKLGHVAGTLTHVAQGLAGALPAGRSGKDLPTKHPGAAAIKTKKSTDRKKSAASSVRSPRTRGKTLRKKAVTRGIARSPRKRAAKS